MDPKTHYRCGEIFNRTMTSFVRHTWQGALGWMFDKLSEGVVWEQLVIQKERCDCFPEHMEDPPVAINVQLPYPNEVVPHPLGTPIEINPVIYPLLSKYTTLEMALEDVLAWIHIENNVRKRK